MDQGQTYEDLKSIIEHYTSRGTDAPAITAESLFAELGIDSPRRIDILLDTEDKFNISIEDSQFDKVRTFGDLVQLVETLTAAS